jgi:hypothetical protein
MVDITNIFTDDFLATVDSNTKWDGDIDVKLLHLPTIPSDDHEPVSIINPNIKQGPWIAGGAALRWYQDQTVGENDIDVFCANAKQAAEIIDRIKSYGRYSVKYESENAVTIGYSKKGTFITSWTIQIITRRYFSSMQEVIDNFDISVCQVGTCGNEWVLGNNTAKDIREKNLRMIMPLHPDAPKRLTKYWVYGYRPVPNLLDAIIANPETRWQFSSEEDYNNAF